MEISPSLPGYSSPSKAGFSLFGDADWGSGKTFFVRQVACILEEVNPFLESHGDLDGLLDNNCELAPYTELNSFLPVYYNAWENDHWDDPLPSIAASIALQGDACASFRRGVRTNSWTE